MTLYCAHYAFSNGRLVYYQENIGGCKVCNEDIKKVECKDVKELREVLEEKHEHITYLNHVNDTLTEDKRRLILRIAEKKGIIASRDRSLINYADSTRKLMEENNSLRNTSTIYAVQQEVARLMTVLENKKQHIASLNNENDSLSDKVVQLNNLLKGETNSFVEAHNERIDLKKKVKELEDARETDLTRFKEMVRLRNRAIDEKYALKQQLAKIKAVVDNVLPTSANVT